MVLQMPLVMVADLGATLENRLDVIEDARIAKAATTDPGGRGGPVVACRISPATPPLPGT